MSSKFLSSDTSTSLEALIDGTFSLNVASASISDLTPGLPVKTNANKVLVSGLIEPADINATLLTNPFVGNLKVSDLETENYLSLEAELDQIEHISNQGSNPNITVVDGILTTDEIKTDRIYDTGGNVFLELDDTDISFNSTNLTFNGDPLVSNPMTSDLNGGGRRITNVQNVEILASNSFGFGTCLTLTQGALRMNNTFQTNVNRFCNQINGLTQNSAFASNLYNCFDNTNSSNLVAYDSYSASENHTATT